MSQNEGIFKEDLLYDTMRLLTQPFVNIGSIIKQKHRYNNAFRNYLGVVKKRRGNKDQPMASCIEG